MWSVWLVFCDCGFHSVCPLRDKDKRLMGSFLIRETDWGGSWVLFWRAGSCSVNLQSNFLFTGGAVVPPCCLTWGQTMVELMRITATSCMHHCTQCSRLCSRPPLTHTSTGDSWTLTGKSGSVSCGVTAPFSWVLVCSVLSVPSQNLFPQSCVSSGSSVVGLMVTSSKRAYATPRSATRRAH